MRIDNSVVETIVDEKGLCTSAENCKLSCLSNRSLLYDGIIGITNGTGQRVFFKRNKVISMADIQATHFEMDNTAKGENISHCIGFLRPIDRQDDCFTLLFSSTI